SLWDMIATWGLQCFQLAQVLSKNLANMDEIVATAGEQFIIPPDGPIIASALEFGAAAEHVRDFPSVYAQMLRIQRILKKGMTVGELRFAYRELQNRLEDELKEAMFFRVRPSSRTFIDQPKLFGDDVFNSFASANDDICEAGNCLALERGTACVLHLMRVMEVGLSVLAKNLGVARRNDWGAYLRSIDEELTGRYKTSGARSTQEQIYA